MTMYGFTQIPNLARDCRNVGSRPYNLHAIVPVLGLSTPFRMFVFLVCVAALLQSRLILAAGHWQQYKASMMQPRKHTCMSRMNTTAAELFYLRHMRSCAAEATGNKSTRNPSQSTGFQIFCASVIGRLLQRICQIVRHCAKIAMKLILVSFAMLSNMLT